MANNTEHMTVTGLSFPFLNTQKIEWSLVGGRVIKNIRLVMSFSL